MKKKNQSAPTPSNDDQDWESRAPGLSGDVSEMPRRVWLEGADGSRIGGWLRQKDVVRAVWGEGGESWAIKKAQESSEPTWSDESSKDQCAWVMISWRRRRVEMIGIDGIGFMREKAWWRHSEGMRQALRRMLAEGGRRIDALGFARWEPPEGWMLSMENIRSRKGCETFWSRQLQEHGAPQSEAIRWGRGMDAYAESARRLASDGASDLSGAWGRLWSKVEWDLLLQESASEKGPIQPPEAPKGRRL